MAQSKALSKGASKYKSIESTNSDTNQVVQPLQISLFNQQTQVILELLIMMPQNKSDFYNSTIRLRNLKHPPHINKSKSQSYKRSNLLFCFIHSEFIDFM